MRQLIDLKVDYAFKLIFGKTGNEPILIAFLNAALKLPRDNQITSVQLLNPELDKNYQDDKKSVLDIRAVTNEGIQVNIEIQLANRYDMDKRTLFYWAEMYTRQMREGMAYQELAKTITINILDFRYIKQTRNYHSVFRLFEIEEGFELTEALEIHFMDYPNKNRIQTFHHYAHIFKQFYMKKGLDFFHFMIDLTPQKFASDPAPVFHFFETFRSFSSSSVASAFDSCSVVTSRYTIVVSTCSWPSKNDICTIFIPSSSQCDAFACLSWCA